MKSRYSICFLSLCFGIILFSALSCKEKPKPIKQTEVAFKKEGELFFHKITSDSTKIALDIEIADTDFDIQTGLMYRNAMQPNQGMLFIFDNEKERYFYMKNTKIPLDLIFINSQYKIVSFQKNAKPFDESSLPSNAPATYVLEVNAEMVDTWGLSVNDSITFNKI